MQTRKQSIIEAGANIVPGAIIAWLFTMLAVAVSPHIPGFEFKANASSTLTLTFFLTFISIARSYVWRRIFNHFHKKEMLKKAKICCKCNRKLGKAVKNKKKPARKTVSASKDQGITYE